MDLHHFYLVGYHTIRPLSPLPLINSSTLFRYIVKKDAPGLTATKIANKIGLRIVQNGDIILKRVFVPDEDRLPGVNSFQDTNKVTKGCITYLEFMILSS